VLHCDDDELSLVALGEAPSPEDEAHLQQCPRCQSRLDQMTAVVASARSITDADRPMMPPVEVWESITRELGVEDTATVTSITAAPSRRAGRTWLLAGAAAVVGVLLGGIVTSGLLNPTDSQELVASADLAPYGDSGFTGTAAVEQRADGAVLTVSVPDLPAVPDGYYEVWMASPDATTMVAIGTLSPGQEGTFTLPAGMAVDSFPVVDVSVEHFDGDAGHSAVSVVRGQLQA
jgi:anti-sigma factor RsiW